MAHDPVFDAKDTVANRFELCVLAFERAKQLIRGARPRTSRKYHNPVTTALAEIAEGKIAPPEAGDEWRLA